MSDGINWRHDYPPTLRAAQIASIYGYTLKTVRKMAQQRNPKIPTPAVVRPFGWNRADVARHYEGRVA